MTGSRQEALAALSTFKRTQTLDSRPTPSPSPDGVETADAHPRDAAAAAILEERSPPAALGDGEADTTFRPVAPICAKELRPATPPTGAPIVEWMRPADLLIDSSYQRDLTEKSIKLIHRIVEGWDWRRFKPPIVAWTERGFEIIDGQHTAIAAATHPDIDTIPVLVVDAADVQDRASAFIGHNRDRLIVSAVQMHHAAVAAGDEDALTVQQVCQRAGVNIVANVFGGYRWRPGDTVAVAAIHQLVGRRGAMRARQILQSLVSAGCSPVAAGEIKAAEMLFSDPDYKDQLEPLPEGADDLAAAIRALGPDAEKEARVFAAAQCVPQWRALGIIWFRKCKKRRRAAA